MRLVIAVLLASSISLSHAVSLPLSYSAGPTYGTVVDDETGKPVQGVMVVAQWVLEGGVHWDRIGVFEAREAVTDAEGNFRMEGWGPRARPLQGVLVASDPQIVTIKPGYIDWINSNYGLAGFNDRLELSVRDSRWNGTVIRIKKVDSTSTKERRETGYWAELNFSKLLQGDDCKFTSIPRTARVLDEHRKRRFPPKAEEKVRGEYLMDRNTCGDLSEFKRVYSNFIQDSAGLTFGSVVDDEGSPVSGAVVVVRWIVARIGTIAVRESVTDEKGRFEMQGWGPITRPVKGFLEWDPEFIVFKAGYKHTSISGGDGKLRTDVPDQNHDWIRNGSTITLSRFSAASVPDRIKTMGFGDPDHYLPVRLTRSYYLGPIEHPHLTTDCGWASTPKMLRAIDDELAKLGPKSVAMIAGPTLMARTNCGQLDDFRKAYEAGLTP